MQTCPKFVASAQAPVILPLRLEGGWLSSRWRDLPLCELHLGAQDTARIQGISNVVLRGCESKLFLVFSVCMLALWGKLLERAVQPRVEGISF